MSASKKTKYGQGSITYNPKTDLWCARYVDGRTLDGKIHRKALYARTKTEVERKLKDAIAERDKAKPEYIITSSVEEYLNIWLTTVKKHELKEKSYDRLEQTITFNVLPYIGHYTMSELRSTDIQAMITSLRDKGLSRSTIKKAKEAIQSAAKWGMRQTPPLLMRNPADGVSIPSAKVLPAKEIQFYTLDEVNRLWEAAYRCYQNGKRVFRLGAAVILAINTGLRLGELVALEWERDIDFKKRTVKVNTVIVRVRDRSNKAQTRYITKSQSSAKTEESSKRSIHLNDNAIEALQDLQKVTGQYKYVLSTKDGKRTSERDFDKMLRRIATQAGFPENKIYGPHALRHTFATLLIYNKVDIKVISQLLGHADVTTTYNTYIHVIKEVEAAAINTLPSIGKKPNPQEE